VLDLFIPPVGGFGHVLVAHALDHVAAHLLNEPVVWMAANHNTRRDDDHYGHNTRHDDDRYGHKRATMTATTAITTPVLLTFKRRASALPGNARGDSDACAANKVDPVSTAIST
jgi:hypothetical protein